MVKKKRESKLKGNWIGHTLTKDPSAMKKRVLDCNQQDARKRWRPTGIT